LSENPLGDDGLAAVEPLLGLEGLSLQNTHVTDRGLDHLKGLRNLRWLYLKDTAVTDAGVEALQNALPDLEIRRQPSRTSIGSPTTPAMSSS
jgi:hypothetical protein